MKIKEIVTTALIAWSISLNAQDQNLSANNTMSNMTGSSKKELFHTIQDNTKEHNNTADIEANKEEKNHIPHHAKDIISLRGMVQSNKNLIHNTFNPGISFGHHFGEHDPIVFWWGVSLRDVNIWFGKEFDTKNWNSISAEIELAKQYESFRNRFTKWLELYVWPRFNTDKISWSIMVWSHLDHIQHKIEPIIKLGIDFNIPLQKRHKQVK